MAPKYFRIHAISLLQEAFGLETKRRNNGVMTSINEDKFYWKLERFLQQIKKEDRKD